jgi:hypothetical protein
MTNQGIKQGYPMSPTLCNTYTCVWQIQYSEIIEKDHLQQLASRYQQRE